MIHQIYKALRDNGFSFKDQDLVNNKRLGIKRSCSNLVSSYHAEIYDERYGFSIHLYGGKRYLPFVIDILENKDITTLREKLQNTTAF